MVLVRRRYYFWLLKAYIKRWRRTIISSLVLGAGFFFLFLLFLNYYVFPIIHNNFEKIGYAGSFTVSTLPDSVLKNISFGLTQVTSKGEIKPAAAQTWKISDNGKVYTFTMQNNLKLGNGKPFKIEDLPYSFKDVSKKILSPTTVQFTIKDPYAPFLAVVSRPIIVGQYGFGKFHISKVDLDSGFIKDLTLSSEDGLYKKLIYFYPTQDALMTAFLLGEINVMENVTASTNPDSQFKNWKNVNVQKNVDYSNLTTIFFNNLDGTLSNKKVRQALLYALPKTFSQGERTFSFLPPQSIYYSKSPNEGLYDLELSKSLLSAANVKNIKITLTVSDELAPVAQEVAAAWKKIGVTTTIQTTNDIPATYQAFMYNMQRPLDPDMYTLWHSGQVNNITHYSNVRIDKLLEEGRQTINTQDRIQIYSDVQKYLLDDAPAAFLYFPYSYTIARK